MLNKRVLYVKVPNDNAVEQDEAHKIIRYVSAQVTTGNIREIRRRRIIYKLSGGYHRSQDLFTVFCRFWKDTDYDLFALFVEAGMKYHADILDQNKYVAIKDIYILLWQYDLDLQLSPEDQHEQFVRTFVLSLDISTICITSRLQKKFLKTVSIMNIMNNKKTNDSSSCKITESDIIVAFRRLAFRKTDYSFALDYIKKNDKITGSAVGVIPRNVDALKYVESVGHGYSDRILLEEFMDHSPECLEHILAVRGLKYYEPLIHSYYWDDPLFTVDRLKGTRILVKHGFYYPTMNRILMYDLGFCQKNLLDGMESLCPIFGDILVARKKIDSRRTFIGLEDIMIIC